MSDSLMKLAFMNSLLVLGTKDYIEIMKTHGAQLMLGRYIETLR